MGMDTKIVGVNVGAYSAEKMSGVITRSSEGAAKLLETSARVERSDIIINGDYAGKDYGISTKESIEALKLVARTEALIIDPVYTGKTMAGMIGAIRDGEFGPDENVVFIHTGGIPALFPYRQEFQPAH
jgi:1-aminocyclopropane-1-carboxylate deaminase/D-cysteine desulfhydrase-like pyridoxal-dependent ACC family enzyme